MRNTHFILEASCLGIIIIELIIQTPYAFFSSLDLGAGSQTPQSAMTLNEELMRLRQQVKELEKENRRLK